MDTTLSAGMGLLFSLSAGRGLEILSLGTGFSNPGPADNVTEIGMVLAKYCLDDSGNTLMNIGALWTEKKVFSGPI